MPFASYRCRYDVIGGAHGGSINSSKSTRHRGGAGPAPGPGSGPPMSRHRDFAASPLAWSRDAARSLSRLGDSACIPEEPSVPSAARASETRRLNSLTVHGGHCGPATPWTWTGPLSELEAQPGHRPWATGAFVCLFVLKYSFFFFLIFVVV